MFYSFWSSQKDEPLSLKVIDTFLIPWDSKEHFSIIEFTLPFILKIAKDYSTQLKINYPSTLSSKGDDDANLNEASNSNPPTLSTKRQNNLPENAEDNILVILYFLGPSGENKSNMDISDNDDNDPLS